MTTRRPRNPQIHHPFLRVMLVLVVLAAVAALSPARAGPAFENAMARVFVVRSDDAADRFLGSAYSGRRARWR